MYQPTDQYRDRVSLRPAVMPDDETFLQELYASTREDLGIALSDESQLRQLVLIQYKGRKVSLAAEFPDAEDWIVLLDGKPVGRLMLDHRSDSIYGVDIAVMSSARNTGVGTSILLRQFEKCTELGVYFAFNVAKGNPAIRLYERLGCKIEGDNGTHFLMTWRPDRSE